MKNKLIEKIVKISHTSKEGHIGSSLSILDLLLNFTKLSLQGELDIKLAFGFSKTSYTESLIKSHPLIVPI